MATAFLKYYKTRAITWQERHSFRFLISPVIKLPHYTYTPEDALRLIYNVQDETEIHIFSLAP